jgi:hypothetical protein
MTQCLALTNNSIQCKRIIKKGEYCYCHHYSHAIYKNCEEWPTMFQVRKSIPNNITNGDQITKYIVEMANKIHTDTCYINHRVYAIRLVEFLLKYRTMFDKEKQNWHNVIDAMVSKLSKVPHLEVYVDYARKKLDRTIRIVAQRKYITFFFTGIVGVDAATIIANFM